MDEKMIVENNSVIDEENIAIQITGLKKRYRLGLITAGTLRGDLQSWWARKRGKEDPNLKIGAKVHSKNEVFMALDGIDLTIYKGERVGIIGHNGAGKSTLLKLLARVTGPTEGEIKIDGRITSMLEVGTGFNGELTGRENVYLNGAILGMTKAEVDRKMEQIVEFSECRQFIDTPVKRYSSGMFVKLAFAVAAHLDSEIMIMDEVLAVGDMAFQKKCLDKMSEVSKDEGRTILYVSHNMNTIRQLCSRCIVMDHGKIIYNGDVEEAIGIYMKERQVLSDFIDTSVKKRPTYLGNRLKAKVQYVRRLNSSKDNENNTLSFEIKVASVESLNGFRVRFEIGRLGRGVAISLTDQLYKMEKNAELTLQFQLDISKLVPATYDTTIVLYEDTSDRSIDIDCVRSFSFIKESENMTMKWNETAWGNILLDSMKEKDD